MTCTVLIYEENRASTLSTVCGQCIECTTE